MNTSGRRKTESIKIAEKILQENATNPVDKV